MFPRGYENAYAYEAERRKDEMRDAKRHQLERQHLKPRRHVTLPLVILSTIFWLIATLMSQ